MNYQELFKNAGMIQFKNVLIAGLGEVRIKKLTAADHMEKERLFQEFGKPDGNGNIMMEPLRLAMLEVRLACVDENGMTFLTESDVAALPKNVVYDLFNAIAEFNRDANLQEIEQTAKKS